MVKNYRYFKYLKTEGTVPATLIDVVYLGTFVHRTCLLDQKHYLQPCGNTFHVTLCLVDQLRPA